jgi:hypothetical protein
VVTIHYKELMNSEIIPVALFTYKRVDHLKKTLEGLKRNKIPILFAFSDGPKNSEEAPLIEEVRKTLKQINWCEVRIVERKNNYGLGTNIRTGITEVLKEFAKIIVIEDDIVMHSGAYDYTVKALFHYENSEEVMSVSMWTDPFISVNSLTEGFFSERFVCWGWGTYKKYWDTYTEKPLDLFNKALQLKINVNKWGKDIKMQALAAEERNLWYVGYLLQHFLNNKISYFPQQTLVENIGSDGSGENAGTKQKTVLTSNNKAMKIPINWPLPKVEKKIARRFARFFEHKTDTKITRIFNKVKNRLKK